MKCPGLYEKALVISKEYLMKYVSKLVLCFFLFFLGACKEEILQTNRQLFPQSVASGDPTQNDIILWTRVESNEEAVELHWEIAKDSLFNNLIDRGTTIAFASNDHAVKVDVGNLESGTFYYYRFNDGHGKASPIGRTKTLPLNTDKVILGLVNCSKYEGGYFNAYNALSKMQNIDVVIHLGDYIYENPSGFPDDYLPAIQKTGRTHLPTNELITLNDYRERYEQYRSDKDLQLLHERYPMINIWDDHEFANDTWSGGAGGHTEEVEGAWEKRKRSAMKAYHEWIPIRGHYDKPIYRSFDFGPLLKLHMIDARICCRSGKVLDSMEVKQMKYSIVGEEQMNWLFKGIEGSSSIWNLIGNQVMFGVHNPNAPISFDNWTGYPKDRKRILEFLSSNPAKNIGFITGDSHEAWDIEIINDKGDVVSNEFLLGSVSSTNLDERMHQDTLRIKEVLKEYENLNYDHLKWYDLVGHGFMTLELTQSDAIAKWYRLSTILDKDYSLRMAYSRKILVKNQE